jgi:hypothetical protein
MATTAASATFDEPDPGSADVKVCRVLPIAVRAGVCRRPIADEEGTSFFSKVQVPEAERGLTREVLEMAPHHARPM